MNFQRALFLIEKYSQKPDDQPYPFLFVRNSLFTVDRSFIDFSYILPHGFNGIIKKIGIKRNYPGKIFITIKPDSSITSCIENVITDNIAQHDGKNLYNWIDINERLVFHESFLVNLKQEVPSQNNIEIVIYVTCIKEGK